MHTQDAEVGTREVEASDSEAVARDGDRPLPWPPPGLGRVQGDAFVAARWLGAGAFLILPLLWVVVSERDPWSLSPLGETLWLTFLLGLAGIPILLGGYVALLRLVRRTVQALEQGHGWRVVALAAADQRRDTGFLLQGARFYRALRPRTRRSLTRNRLLVAGMLLLAALWLSLGFGLSMVLAARGYLDSAGVVLLTLAPSVVAVAVAILAYAWEEGVLRRTRKRWHRRPWTEDMVREEVAGWNAAMAERTPGFTGTAPDPSARGGRARRTFKAANVVLAGVAVVAFVPVFALVFSAAILPTLARVAVPTFDGTQARYATLEPLRRYTLDPDPSISAIEAGATLHTLTFVGRSYRASEGVLPPARSYERPWFPAANGMPTVEAEWTGFVVERMGERLDAETVAYFERVSEHPAHVEITRLARAPGLDVAAARWSMPLPSEITLAELGMPTMAPVQAGATAHLATAALMAHRGDVAGAETAIREVLSVGFLMADHGPTFYDNLVGIVIAGRAGEALESLFGTTGRADAAELAWLRESSTRTIERAQAGRNDDVESRLRAMPGGVVDPDLPRGIRLEYVNLLNTLGPCMNLRRVVFGPDAGYDALMEDARSALVRSPAEAELFALARGGMLGGDLDEPPTVPTRVLALTMGGAGRPGSCARVFAELVGF